MKTKAAKAIVEPVTGAIDVSGQRIMERLDRLATFTEVPGEVTRTYLTPALKAAGEQLIAWMREAGMTAGFDALGNVLGHYAGNDPKAPVILAGSHYDSVRNAGKYDGPYGVIAAIEAVAVLHARGERFSAPIDIVAFGDEEGVRFRSTLIGSRALAGTLDPAVLDTCDEAGISMRDALVAFGGDPAKVKSLARKTRSTRAYLELHIEQGPVLAQEEFPVGIVTSIAGASRFAIRLEGQTGHAGTVPMGMRRDAAVAAAEIVLAVERRTSGRAGLLGTVGVIATPGGAANVIPGLVEISLDVRADGDIARQSALHDIMADIESITRRRAIRVTITATHDANSVACDSVLQTAFATAIKANRLPVFRLASGAGHDAMAMAELCPSAMLFVRCGNGGISHDPREIMTRTDAETGARVLLATLRLIASPT